MKVAIGSDHAGVDLKGEVLAAIKQAGIEVEDFGTHDAKSVDYPDVAKPVAEAVSRGEFDRGILICGTGIGMSIAANKVKGIRAALCHDTFSASQTREHNDSNILCMGARVVGAGVALDVVKVWLGTDFSREERHARRVQKIGAIEG